MSGAWQPGQGEALTTASHRAGLPHCVLPGQPVLQHGPLVGAVVPAQLLPGPAALELLPSGHQPHRWHGSGGGTLPHAGPARAPQMAYPEPCSPYPAAPDRGWAQGPQGPRVFTARPRACLPSSERLSGRDLGSCWMGPTLSHGLSRGRPQSPGESHYFALLHKAVLTLLPFLALLTITWPVLHEASPGPSLGLEAPYTHPLALVVRPGQWGAQVLPGVPGAQAAALGWVTADCTPGQRPAEPTARPGLCGQPLKGASWFQRSRPSAKPAAL